MQLLSTLNVRGLHLNLMLSNISHLDFQELEENVIKVKFKVKF